MEAYRAMSARGSKAKEAPPKPETPLGPRRRVDWRLIEGSEASRAHLITPSAQSGDLAQLTSDIFADPSAKTIDSVLRKAVEFARHSVGLERAAIYLVSPDGRSMMGTWGTDQFGKTTDEHDLMINISSLLRQSFARASQGHAWSLFDDCPLITHEGGQSRVLRRGWHVCTVIQGGGEPIGVMFNDTALSGAPVDEGQQARLAVLCSVLGRALEPSRVRIFDTGLGESKAQHPLVREAARILLSDPSISYEEVAKRLHVSGGYLTRTFRRFADMSIVEYRNQLRLAQLLNQIREKPLATAAVDAGFGSYAQFHRVFRARFGKSPREYLFEQRITPVDDGPSE